MLWVDLEKHVSLLQSFWSRDFFGKLKSCQKYKVWSVYGHQFTVSNLPEIDEFRTRVNYPKIASLKVYDAVWRPILTKYSQISREMLFLELRFCLVGLVLASDQAIELRKALFDAERYDTTVIQDSWRKVTRADYRNLGKSSKFLDSKTFGRWICWRAMLRLRTDNFFKAHW